MSVSALTGALTLVCYFFQYTQLSIFNRIIETLAYSCGSMCSLFANN